MRRRFLAFLAVLGMASCSPAAAPLQPAAPPPDARSITESSQAPALPIDHVFLLIQENRSFDNLFATYPGANGTTTGVTHDGKVIALRKMPMEAYDIGHLHTTWVTEYHAGKMDGFDLIRHGGADNGGKAGTYPYQYVDPNEIQPYWTIARQYVLADNMFQTQGGSSFSAHQDLIRGGTEVSATQSVVDSPNHTPWGCDSPKGTKTALIDASGKLPGAGPFPCFDWLTLRDLLDARGIAWKYYTGPICCDGGNVWSAFDAIRAVRYGPQWKTNVSTPSSSFLRDAGAGRLPQMAWIVPGRYDSDHPWSPKHPNHGPSWVAQVVNAIGTSKIWKRSAIVIVWDDWGGWYDHVAPPQLDYEGLGFRVPMLVVSPYARKGYVAHTQYEFGSIVRFIEDVYHLGRLGTTDVRATSIAGVFDFNAPPRAFTPIPSKDARAFFERENAIATEGGPDDQ